MKKNNASNKTSPRKSPVKRNSKNSKAKKEGKKVFLLVSLIILSSAVISILIINYYSSSGRNESGGPDIRQITETPPDTKSDIDAPYAQSPHSAAAQPDTASPPAETGTSAATEPFVPPVVAQPERQNSASQAAGTAEQKKAELLGTLVFVIDDAGNNLYELDPFLRIPYPLTIAVLPGLPHSAEAARRIRDAGKEVILHQPMEALGGQNPGPGAIYSYMSEDEIREVLLKNLAEIGPVSGMNNHQGSKITMDSLMMGTILEFCAEHNLYFLDSRTTSDTVIPAAARQAGVKITERNVFLDNEQDRQSMLNYLDTGLSLAQRNGSAVMIGHTWSVELAPVLASRIPVLISLGYEIKNAGDVVR